MGSLDKAVATQLANIEKKTGKSLAALGKAIAGSGKSKHGEVRAWLIDTYGLGYGDANALAGVTLKGLPAVAVAVDAAGGDAVLDGIYKDKKAHQRPIHEALMAGIAYFTTIRGANAAIDAITVQQRGPLIARSLQAYNAQ